VTGHCDWNLKPKTSKCYLGINGKLICGTSVGVDYRTYCKCTNETNDAKCGIDHPFLGIRCPDNSACLRKCCNGYFGGSCENGITCRCTNNQREIDFGHDVVSLVIGCPFDSSACRRKCYLSGQSGGRCEGFLKTKCECH
jgi:hypothetical protein